MKTLLEPKNRFAESPIDMAELSGYLHCMEDILEFIKQETQSDSNKRMIDSAKITDLIYATNTAITPLIKQAQEEVMTELKELIK